MSKEKTNRARKFAADAVERIVVAGRKTPNLYVKIAQRMTTRSGEQFHRQEVAAWLHEDAAKRIEPRLGAGLLLLDVATKLLARRKAKRKEAAEKE